MKEKTPRPSLSLIVFEYYNTGNERLLNTVFSELKPALTKRARKLGIWCTTTANEIVQRALVTLLGLFRERKFTAPAEPGQAPGSGLLFAYAYTVLGYTISGYYQNDATRPSTPGPLEDPLFALSNEAADDTYDPEHEMHQQQASDVIAVVTRAVLGLPLKQRQYIILVWYQGLTLGAAAKQVGASKSKFANRQYKAFALLRQELKSLGITPTPELYQALRDVDTGNLFKHKEPALTAHQERAVEAIERADARQVAATTSLSAAPASYLVPPPRASPSP